MTETEPGAVTPGQVAYEARRAAKGRRMGAADDTPDHEIIRVTGNPWDDLPPGQQADEEAGASAVAGYLADAYDAARKHEGAIAAAAPAPQPDAEALRIAVEALADISVRDDAPAAARRACDALDRIAPLAAAAPAAPHPRIVCLCGSTRFYGKFRSANLQLTLAGQIVLSIGCDTKSDGDLAAAGEMDLETVKDSLDRLHRHKIAMADYVLVVSDETGYFGDSTAGEIRYAVSLGKPVEFEAAASEDRARRAGLIPADSGRQQ
jgi:hypothetical protein